MTNHEAIRIIKTVLAVIEDFEVIVQGEKFTKKKCKEAVEIATEALSRSENPNKWVPVSERLPKAGEYVGDVAKYYLVQNEYGDMLVARYTHSEYWEQMYQLKPIADEIVAWMPLPEPMKVGEEDC